MCIRFAIVALICGFPLVSASQHSFSDSSRLGNPAYVRNQIREISDADLWIAINTDLPELIHVRSALHREGSSRAILAWAEYWKSKSQPIYITTLDRLLLDTDLLSDVDAFRNSMNELPDERDTILARAQLLLGNTIQTWGDSIVRFGKEVDFNREIGRSGKYGFHYWFWCRPLLMAWLHTGDDLYAQKFEELFNKWYHQRNTIVSGIPDLDVVYYELGLGVRNRIFIEFFLQHFNKWTPLTHSRMLKTMLAAGRWLYELERWEGYRPGNWQIHGSYMLSQIAMTFPEFRESPEWLRMGLQRMSEHLDRDFFSDGGHSERCPRNYTLATYVSFRNLAYLLEKYRVRPDFAKQMRASMGRTIEWWLTMITPEGESPAINDSHRGLFPARILKDGAALWGRPEVGGVMKNLLHEPITGTPNYPPFTSRNMPASGFAVMRSDWTSDAFYMSVNYGAAAGFHTHLDLLDFELYAYGKPLAVDAGIGMTYDDPLYESWYKSSRAHNMVVVNDSNIARDGKQGEDVRWGSTSRCDYLEGEQNGYERFGVRQRRQIAFLKPFYWFVLDDVSCTKSGDTLSWYLHAPGSLTPSGSGFASATAPGILILPADQHLSTRTGKGWAASSSVTLPGRTELIPWIRFDQVTTRDSVHQFAILLSPFRSAEEQRSTRRISSRHYRVSSGGADDDLYFANGSFADGTLETDARFVLMRRPQSGRASFSIVDGTYLKFARKLLWSSPERTSAEGELAP